MPLSLLLLVLSGVELPLHPAPDRLAPWTTTLRDQQPDDAFAAVYRVGPKRLVFVAAKHANKTDSLTFRLIDQAYAQFTFDTVIAEGFATARGANPPSLLKYAAENKPTSEGFVEGGETIPTVLGAQKEGAALWGGEAHDLAVKAALMTKGFAAEDLLGFYVLRNIPQWIGERKLADAGDARLEALVVAALEKNRATLSLGSDVLPSFAAWAEWYRSLNGKAIDGDFITEEVGPLADGRFGTNRIAYAVSLARDAHLHQRIVAHLNAGESVLVVYGASHLLIHRSALDAILGKPCYVGGDLASAATACR
jgi:hypothetical protein